MRQRGAVWGFASMGVGRLLGRHLWHDRDKPTHDQGPGLPSRFGLEVDRPLRDPQHLACLVDQLLSLGGVVGLGDDPDDRFGVAWPDVYPPVGPIDPDPVL